MPRPIDSILRSLLLGAAFFLLQAAALSVPAHALALDAKSSAAAVSPALDLPRVKALATTDPAMLLLLDQDGKLLRQQALMDRSAQLRSSACAILVLAARKSFLVVFADMPEMWEVSYNPSAPEIGLGMVHDFQYREGHFVPGYLHPQRITLPWLAGAVVPGQDGHTVVLKPKSRSGAVPAVDQAPLVIHLDVRKPVSEPAEPAGDWTACP